MTVWHKSLESRFGAYSSGRQVLMVCNELNRADHSQDEPEEYARCLERALELLDLAICETDNKNDLRERLRARHVMAQYYLEPPQSTKSLQKVLIQLEPEAWRQIGESFD